MRLAYALLQAASSALYLPHQTGTPSAHSGRSHSLAHSRSRPIVQSHGIGGGGGDGFGGFGGGGGGAGGVHGHVISPLSITIIPRTATSS